MKKILVVVDLQNDFVTGPLGNDDTRLAAKNSVDLVSTGWFDKIIFTRDTHGRDYLDTLEGRKLPVEHCVRGTEGWEIIPEFKLCHPLVEGENGGNVRDAEWMTSLEFQDGRVPEIHVVDKPTFGSLLKVRNPYCESLVDAIYVILDSFKMDTSIDYVEDMELHFCGVCTSICVLSNMVLCRAAFPNTRIVLHTKATGDVDEESKRAAFKVLENIQCDLED